MDDDLNTQVAAADTRARIGRVARLKVLLSAMPEENYPVDALAREYFEEARLCWYVGAFVSTVLMAQLAFEELLRSSYRVARGVGGKLDCGVSVDQASFAQLIQQGRKSGFLSGSEFNEVDSLRVVRNPYVHTKDSGNEGPTYLDQLIKITARELVGSGVEDEARQAVRLLIRLFPVLCLRM